MAGWGEAKSLLFCLSSHSPDKRQRRKLRAQAEELFAQTGSRFARGMDLALKWADGLMSDEEIQEMLESEGA